MLKKRITFTDYDGNERSEEFYFNLNEMELTKMNLNADGGSLDKILQKIIDTKDIKEVIKLFEMIILTAYGEKSMDGRTFIKNDEVRAKYTSSEAYNVLFMELIGDSKKASEFVRGIVPKDLAMAAAAREAERAKMVEQPKEGTIIEGAFIETSVE